MSMQPTSPLEPSARTGRWARVDRFRDALDRQRSWLPLLIRIPLGATFMVHGYDKLFERGVMATAAGFANRGIPLGGVLGPVVPFAEFVGGACVLLGLATRFWAFLQAWVMAFAILFVHGHQGFRAHAVMVTRDGKQVAASAGWEWQLLLLACALFLAVGGAGTISIDRWIGRRGRRDAKGEEPCRQP